VASVLYMDVESKRVFRNISRNKNCNIFKIAEDKILRTGE
jgi:hypothetical protein